MTDAAYSDLLQESDDMPEMEQYRDESDDATLQQMTPGQLEILRLLRELIADVQEMRAAIDAATLSVNGE